MPEADMRAYCSTEIFKSLVGKGTEIKLTKEDLVRDGKGQWVITKERGIMKHPHVFRDGVCRYGCTTYRVVVGKRQRLGREAVLLADALLWALETVGVKKEKKSV